MFDKHDWTRKLKELGVKKGMLVVLDGRLDYIHYTISQYNAFLDALFDCVTSEGTIVYVAFHQEMSEPAHWEKDIPVMIYPKIRKQLASSTQLVPFEDPLAMTMLLRDDTIIKRHPAFTVLAVGKYARFVTRKIPLHYPNGELGPMEACFDLKAHIIIMNDVSLHSYPFHYALSKQTDVPIYVHGGVMIENGTVRWQKYLDVKVSYTLMKQRMQKIVDLKKSKQVEIFNDKLYMMACEHIIGGGT